MPYITQDSRKIIDEKLESILKYFNRAGDIVTYDGEMNYVITKLLLSFYGNKGVLGKDNRGYQAYNRAMGVIGCVQQEFYRRVIVPYETQKIQDNGDVFNVK
jgi:hypothetical protein